ncbi:MAG: hypothetical protein GTO71_07165 [Woeseiaceae bacterium]|nr:hypothetical protein [Woeseiaceae bacterium]NIP20874.1 hypothetical protein [Woeseiaceae bacterium]
MQQHLDLTDQLPVRASFIAHGQELIRLPLIDRIRGQTRRFYRLSGPKITTLADSRETEARVASQPHLQLIKNTAHISYRHGFAAKCMQAEMIETRLEVDRVRSRNPDPRPLAGLSPHSQRPQPGQGDRKLQPNEDTLQHIQRGLELTQLRTLQPEPKVTVLQTGSFHGWQDNSRGLGLPGKHYVYGKMRCLYDVRMADGNGKRK